MNNTTVPDHGVHATAHRLTESLRSYIEAQYHIRDESLIRERRRLLEEHGAVSQVPFVESTPVYELGSTYDDLTIPEPAKLVLNRLAGLNVGLYPRPYVHQTTALEAFFEKKADLIVATGTGSGKTESFLMPILGQLAVEATERPQSAALPGVRALLMYPMNALVNDQLSRIRRLFGSENAAREIKMGRPIPVRFASYTGRTAYPGPRSSQRDGERIEPLFEEFYLPIINEPAKEAQLRAIGQLPEKDLQKFFNKDAEEIHTSRAGKHSRRRNWKNRLLTQEDDRELMTRHESQTRCPELLITNYSMLEYMLMRPIERPLFQQTREWLQADPANELIIVLDEAHMYRGAGGAEVALLLRRLLSRLNVPRTRVRFILTSASLGSGDEATRSITRFGRDLTGLSDGAPRTFEVIRGTREERRGARAGTADEAGALHNFDIAGFERHATDEPGARAAVCTLSAALGWPAIGEEADLADYIFERLTGFGPSERLIQLVSGTAMPLPELEAGLFGVTPMAERATASLIALATFARRRRDNRVLLPTRLHMFFRGLPALFACINPRCNSVREHHANQALGRLYTHARERCQCGARVYELATHRECGTAFIRGYMSGPHGDFLWHQPSGLLREGHQLPLAAVELLVGEPHRERRDRCVSVWVDIQSGRVLHADPNDDGAFKHFYLPEDDSWTRSVQFTACPVCRDTTVRSGRSAIMDHATKGEAPFANLVKTQLDSQPAVTPETRELPNGGRKVLLFSDGRQKAARLARDIPREVEHDIFRQVLAMAAQRLQHIGREPRPTVHLYTTVLTVLRDFNLPMFDRDDARKIEDEIAKLDRDFEGDDLATLLTEFVPGELPSRYKIAMLKQLCGRYYSLAGTSVGTVLPISKSRTKLRTAVRAAVPLLTDSDADELASTWMRELCDRFAVDKDIPPALRSKAAGFWSTEWGSGGKFEKTLRKQLPSILGIDEPAIAAIENAFRQELAWKNESNAFFLDPSKIQIHIDLSASWYQCRECTDLAPSTIRSHCLSCASTELETLAPDASEYFRARKSFWRDPVHAALGAHARLRSISVEEHTAQLSNRDNTRVHATTEKFELRFRDIQIEDRDKPIDVLSCTTTMEVGVDIGSLVAVGLRNVPPQRENYQQRAGRAGRRGSSVSTVLTYAQNGPHDTYYYDNPRDIVAGPPRNPDIKIDNPKIARRHVASYLLQTFFHRYMDEHNVTTGSQTSALFRALGKASDFFFGDANAGPTFEAFRLWVDDNVIAAAGINRSQIKSWIPATLRVPDGNIDLWIGGVAFELLEKLQDLKAELRPPSPMPAPPHDTDRADEDEDIDERNALGDEELLEFLFGRGMLPSYAFPTDLTSFLVETLAKQPNGTWKTEIKERPQQGIGKALSEYAPGRLIVINKETYRSGGVTANTMPTVHDRASELFEEEQQLVHCSTCSFVRDLKNRDERQSDCPVCSGELERTRMIKPQVFLPEGGRALPEDDREQEITYATSAQFPVPVGTNDLPDLRGLGPHLAFEVTTDRQLVTVNKGPSQNDASQGFWICDKCGRAESEQPAQAAHERPYRIEFAFNQPKPTKLCDGAFHNVFLGHIFSTDLLLMRFTLAPPMALDTGNPVVLRALEDALYSISEALRLAASRFPQLDLDPSEFGSGFRIVPSNEDETLHLDVYLYDTLSGGAGYAELAGRFLDEILADVLKLLEHCPADCDRSCESCLRHYHNQHLKDRLDRFIGAQLLRYGLTGELPRELSAVLQAKDLAGLSRLLQLDGFTCTPLAEVQGSVIPLLVERNGRAALVGTQSGLLQDQWPDHSLAALIAAGRGRALNEFILRRNLPDEHQLIRSLFPA